jgi:two-component system, sensor histidine kinase
MGTGYNSQEQDPKIVNYRPMNLLQHIVTSGCSNVMDEDKNRTIRIVNTLCLTCGSMSMAFSLCCYFLTGGSLDVSLPAFIEASLLFSLIALNKFGHHTAASLALIIVQNITIQWYSAIMGRVTEVHLLFIFLVGLALLLFDSPKLRRLSIGITILSFLAGEINMYNGFIKPVVEVNDHTGTQFVIRWVTIPSILILDMLVIYYYVKHVDRLRKREMQHISTMLNTVKEHNKHLELLTAKLAKATDAKTIFVRETSHEIRTPLNAIFGISQLLQLKVEQDESYTPIRQLTDHLYAAAYNTREIINNVLEFSRIEAGKVDSLQLASFELRSWVESIVAMHQYVANVKLVKIKYSIADSLPQMLTGDKILLTKTMNNLLSNAIKFTAQESTVILKIDRHDSQWTIRVSDQGAGIPEEKLNSIFDPFVSERNIFLEGTGLGLHITKHLTEVMGGRISVQSTKGKGTAFSITLPVYESGSTAERISLPADELVNLHDTTILIIEDDKMSQMVLSRFLQGLGSRIMVAADGMEGLLLARASRPDIIILDSHIPGLSGKETLASIRSDAYLKNVPVIIASGDAFKEASEEMLLAGANEYMVKPIEFNALHATLTKYLQTVSRY